MFAVKEGIDIFKDSCSDKLMFRMKRERSEGRKGPAEGKCQGQRVFETFPEVRKTVWIPGELAGEYPSAVVIWKLCRS